MLNGLLELLTTFSPLTIVLCCIMILAAFKSIVEYRKWMHSLFDDAIEKREKDREIEQTNCKLTAEHNAELRNISATIVDIQKSIRKMDEQIDILTRSDKDDIKAFITREYHYFTEQKGWIDDYSMDCIEKRYSHYKEYHGNTFIDTLMEELRDLPRNYEDRLRGVDTAE